MDMLRFKKLVPNRREALASGPDTPLPKEYRTNQQAERLHPGYMEVELTKIRPLAAGMKEFTFRRVDSSAFPFSVQGSMYLYRRRSGILLSAVRILLYPRPGTRLQADWSWG